MAAFITMNQPVIKSTERSGKDQRIALTRYKKEVAEIYDLNVPALEGGLVMKTRALDPSRTIKVQAKIADTKEDSGNGLTVKETMELIIRFGFIGLQ
jgi:hypothetical protein